MKLKEYLSKFNLVYVTHVQQKWSKYKSPLDSATLREIAPNEIVIEFDTNRENALQLVRKTTRHLNSDGYNFSVLDHGGRSPHIHIYDVVGLESLDEDMRRVYKKLFTRQYAPYSQADDSLSGVSLIAMEGKPHFKYGTIKKLIYESVGFSNTLDINILNDANSMIHYKVEDDLSRLSFDNRWLIKWVLDFKDYKHNMDIWLFKNVAITLVNEEMDLDSFTIEFILVYGSSRLGHLFGWIRWAKRQRRYVCIAEIMKFCEMYELDWREVQELYRSNKYIGDENND